MLVETLAQARRGRHLGDVEHFLEKGIVTPAFDRIEIALARRKQRDVADDAIGMRDAVTQRDRIEIPGEVGAGDPAPDQREGRNGR